MNYTKGPVALLAPLLVATVMSTFVQAKDISKDSDNDGIVDAIDNCVYIPNPKQRDSNADGFGNFCDADFNDNFVVDEDDEHYLKTLLESKLFDEHVDLNGDGFVDKVDAELFQKLFKGEPGPSGFKVNASFVLAPPPAQETTLYQLDQETKTGANAAVTVNFELVDGLEGVVPFNVAGQTVALNDLGVLPDLKAGDRRYAAYFNFDFVAQKNDDAQFNKRSELFNAKSVGLFSGRSLIKRVEVPPSMPKHDAPIIKLPNGRKLIPFHPKFDDFRLLPVAHDEKRSLMVVHPDVIADSARTFDLCDYDGDGSVGSVDGAWSFKTLMTNIANTPRTNISAQQFTHNWLMQWMTSQNSITPTINPRSNLQSFFPGWDAQNAHTLNMDKLPFRLLAIVNRIDLAQTSAYGMTGSPGEIRLVFGLIRIGHPDCSAGSQSIGAPMTVIFEYGDTTSHCVSLKTRASQWVNLSLLAPGSSLFNHALQNITDDVTSRNAVFSKPNGSALNQIRTNEIALGSPWQLREFRIDTTTGFLFSDTIKQTPDPFVHRTGSDETKAFMEANGDAISCEAHVIPDTFNGEPFIGTHTNYSPGTVWRESGINVFPGTGFCHESTLSGHPSVNDTVIHKLSLNTCDACHARETNTLFTHIDPRSFPSDLSGFLEGNVVTDQRESTIERAFDDLARRGQILEDLAVKSCLSPIHVPTEFDPQVFFPPFPPEFKAEINPKRFDVDRVHFGRLQQRIRNRH